MLGSSAEVIAHRTAYLALERLAVEPYLRFVYDDAAQADLIRERLFSDVMCEFSPANARFLLIGGKPAGIICCMPGPIATQCRMKAALYLVKSGLLDGMDDVRRRMEVASGTLLKLTANDFYISRIAVDPNFGGSGAADELMRYCEHEARRSGAARICLEVSHENERAIHFYARHGFEKLDIRSVEATVGRSLSYLHMAKPVTETQ